MYMPEDDVVETNSQDCILGCTTTTIIYLFPLIYTILKFQKKTQPPKPTLHPSPNQK